MAQGFSKSKTQDVAIADGANLDAFSRLRVSNPESLFSVQCQYNAAPLQMEGGATGTGSSPTHLANNRMVRLRVGAGSGTSFLQSYQYSPYQPGKSHLIAITGLLSAAVADAVVDFGYFDATNGVFFRQNGTGGLQFVRRTSTSGSVVDNAVAQSSWNIDKLDGTGASGYTLDAAKVFILIIDLQFLGMGRVRVGFDIDGVVIYAHEFLNANSLDVPYMQTATLPVQALVTATATADTKDAFFKCAAVSSEGGLAQDFAFAFSTPEATETAASGARTHLLSIRPKTTFNSIANRELFLLDTIEIFVTGNQPVFWELCIGATLAASTWADVNAANSAYEYTSVRGSFTNLTSGIAIASGYCAASNQTKTAISRQLANRYPITLDRAGAVRAMGTMTLLVSGIGGTSATRASINFKEIR